MIVLSLVIILISLRLPPPYIVELALHSNAVPAPFSLRVHYLSYKFPVPLGCLPLIRAWLPLVIKHFYLPILASWVATHFRGRWKIVHIHSLCAHYALITCFFERLYIFLVCDSGGVLGQDPELVVLGGSQYILSVCIASHIPYSRWMMNDLLDMPCL